MPARLRLTRCSGRKCHTILDRNDKVIETFARNVTRSEIKTALLIVGYSLNADNTLTKTGPIENLYICQKDGASALLAIFCSMSNIQQEALLLLFRRLASGRDVQLAFRNCYLSFGNDLADAQKQAEAMTQRWEGVCC